MNSLIVLAYHSINEKPHSDQTAPLSVHPEDFEAQIRYLLSRGYRNIRADELGLKSPSSAITGKRRFLISFDDGYKDNYDVALPILEACGCSALIFLSTNGIENSSTGEQRADQYHTEISIPYMNWDEVRIMEAKGVEFGSHTLSHAHLSCLNSDKLRQEIVHSKQLMEERLGHSVEWFCAPYGDYPEIVYYIVRQHYQLSFLTYAYRSVLRSRPDVISRIGVYGHNSLNTFKLKLLRDRLRIV